MSDGTQPLKYDPNLEPTFMRQKLLKEKGYAPYCGNDSYKDCHMPRTRFNGKQFYCWFCGWTSAYPESFIKKYKEQWGLE